jgi:hypothetical protein
VTPETAAALSVLVDGFSPSERDRVAADLVQMLRFAYSASDGALTEWLRGLGE